MNLIGGVLLAVAGVSSGSESTIGLLLRAVEVGIPAEQNHCELVVQHQRATVGDFMASFTIWSLDHQHSKDEIAVLSCKDNECSLTFGYKAIVQPWRRTLKFSIVNNAINPDSLECVDVP